MKMKIRIVAILICFLIIYHIPYFSEASASTENIEYTSDGIQIKEKFFTLVYDHYTKIVYYKNGGTYLPYISYTGSYCRYIDGKIIPIR